MENTNEIIIQDNKKIKNASIIIANCDMQFENGNLL